MRAYIIRTVVCVAAVHALSTPDVHAAGRIPDFCFLQISDTHINPQPVGAPDPTRSDRSVEALEWFSQEASKPQNLQPYNITVGPPAFAINTGDMMEFGAVGKTFANFEACFKNLPIPLYLVAGNHDNTWAGVMQILRDKFGGDHYSFDRYGCHFAIIDTATPQEPTPTLEQRTLTWLANDLRKVDPQTPVFIFCHHPLSSSEFAKPYEQLRFFEVIRPYNVVCVVMGHGHSPVYEKWGPIDSVMGGSTFGPHTGYSTIAVKDETLYVSYRFRDKPEGYKPLLKKSIKRPTLPDVQIVQPAAGARITGSAITVRAGVRGGEPTAVRANVNELKSHTVTLEADRPESGEIKLDNLPPGEHFIRLTADFAKISLDRAIPFTYAPPGSPKAVRVTVSAGMKAGPLLLGDDAIVATTAGDIIRVSFSGSRGSSRVLFNTGAEVLHAPALVDKTLYVASGNGLVHALDLTGKVLWKCQVTASCYGTPAVDATSVYVADLQGHVHAIDRRTGKLRWSKQIAPYSIEMAMLLHDGTLYFGAWDGQVYAVDAASGSVKWKTRSPGGQKEAKFTSRYYAAGDASPVIVGERLFVADRAYRFGMYDLTGKYLGELGQNIAAIALTEDGQRVLARSVDAGLTCYDGEGKQLWSSDVKLGRFPIPPTQIGDKIYVCANRGLLSVLSAADGKVLWQYQATPNLSVMAPVTADAKGNAYVVGMDGSVTRVSQKE